MRGARGGRLCLVYAESLADALGATPGPIPPPTPIDAAAATTPTDTRAKRRAALARNRRDVQSASSRDAVDSSVRRCHRRRRRLHHRHRCRRWRRLVAHRVSCDEDDKSVEWRRDGNRGESHCASRNVVVSLTSRHRGRKPLSNGLGRRAHRPGGLVPVAPAVRGYIIILILCIYLYYSLNAAVGQNACLVFISLI